MKPLLRLCALCVLCGSILFATGCASATARISPTKEGLAKRAVAIGLGLVLRNNPDYKPLAQVCMDRIDAVIARGYTNPQLVADFVAELAANYNLKQDEAEKIQRTIADLQLAYTLIFGEPFPANVELSENAKAFLDEVKLHIATAAGLAVYFLKV